MYPANKKPKNFDKGERTFSLIYCNGWIVMCNHHCCYIKESFFLAHPEYQKMLDPGNTAKQARRTHVCVQVAVEENCFYIPLRNNLGEAVRKFGRIGHPVPSHSRPKAGLDFRYAVIINDSQYIEPHTTQKLPNSQYTTIINAYEEIKQQFLVYLKGYKRAAAKGRIAREPLFRESSLINFHRELGL